MPDQPDQPDQFQPDGTVPGQQPEYLGEVEAPARHGRRWAVVGAASVAVVAAAGVGAWGVAQLLSTGDSPASAVPAGAVAYLSLDLDPSATQKIEALRILKKFPSIEKELDLGLEGDLRRWAFEKVQEEGECTDVDYGADVEPWLGDRVAVAGVPGKSGEVLPLVVVQVSDPDAAEAGVAKLAACGEEEVATAVVGDYLLLGEDQVEVDVMAAEAGSASLQDDADFTTWMDRAGSSGIITGYVAPEAVDHFAEEMADAADSGEFGPGSGENVPERLEELYAGFEGAAMVVRFADGGVETEVVAGGEPMTQGMDGSDPVSVADLPASTALAMAVSLPENWLADYTDTMAEMMGQGMSPEDFWTQLELQSGLELPEDAETLLGDSLTLAVDGDVDFSEPDPATFPAAVRIGGDPAEITRVVDKLLALVGPEAEQVVVEQGEDTVTIGLSREYVDRLVAGGDLGKSASFADVVPDADRATGVFYLDFDAGDGWAERLAETLGFGDKDVAADVAPLDALGASQWMDGETAHFLVRLSTD